MAIPKQGPVIAIDGPAGTGKSSTTQRLCEELGYVHIDTGALYRSIALLCLDQQILDTASVEAFKGDKNIPEKISNQATDIARKTHLEFHRNPKRNPSNRVLANGTDVTGRIRSPEVSMAASLVSAVPGVRAALLGVQRRLGCQGKAILEGRDIGTVIFPDADLKFFLTASIEERAKRRLAELEGAGADVPSFEQVKRDLRSRDEGDSTRKVAPLLKAADAVEIDTTSYTLDEVVQKMAEAAKARIG